MFLKKCIGYKGRIFLEICESFRNEKGNVTHRVVEKLGYLEDLQKMYKDPIAHFTNRAKEMSTESRSAKTFELDTSKEMKKGESSLRNVGYLAFKPILNKLKLKSVCSALESKYQTSASIYDILSFLIYSKIINASSKHSDYRKINQFFEKYSFSESQMYRVLSTIGNSHETIRDYLFETTKEAYGLDTGVSFYDGTNFYFEIDREDDFRKKGPSKEKRVEPLVSVGLLLDKNFIPIDYTVYPGNESEKGHFRSVIEQMKEKKKISGRTVYVADRGLNCGNNIFSCIENGDGYIYSQTVKGASEKMKKYIENDVGFEEVFDEFGVLEYRIKGFIDEEAEIAFDFEGRKIKRNCQQLQIVTWSRKYADKSRYEREKLIAKAKSLISHPKDYDRSNVGEVADFIKRLSYNSHGEIVEDKSVLQLDWDKIHRAERMDGYYLIVTSELMLSPKEVLSIYRNLSNIEESFRVSKTFLKLRPVFLHREERIKAHVLVCYIALLLLRLLETKVLKHQFSFHSIISNLREYQCALIKPNIYFFFSFNDVVSALGLLSASNVRLKSQSLSDIKKLFSNY